MRYKAKMENKKILIIGAEGFSGIACLNWARKELEKLNIADYDVVIINLETLGNENLHRGTQKLIKAGLEKVLETQGTVVALGTQKRTVNTYFEHAGRRLEAQNNYDWCPIPLEIKNDSGTSIEFKDDLFKEYFTGAWFSKKGAYERGVDDLERYCKE